ncbi:cytoplasmic protein [Syntrophotalea acetylenivorans]|uniref:Cytoplasmic protein n=1 Tax=Syntrophotalea acetylenivorans TaxID=1842532 RepID=A0A1L3GM91_9BACT|nr:DUF362 domain-containing protein [Syntrophotalea acetylenivorans]APG27049.1 cytoplasmic protein [Syntrophotalea acetylenivorans]
MDRRRFLHDAAFWSLSWSLALQWPFLSAANPPAHAAPGNLILAKVGMGKGKDYPRLVRQVVTLVGGMHAFVKPGARVVIKPNIGFDRPPEMAATTHPLVVRTLAEMALEAGAGQVRIFDRTCYEARRCYQNSGILPAIKAMDHSKVRCDYIDRRKFVTINIPQGRNIKSWDIYRDALEADCYINVPVAKQHGLAGLSLGLKNSMGVLGGNRGHWHRQLEQNLADLATVLRPTLTVIDATRMLLRNGPQGGNLRDVKINDTILASSDPVAADALATMLFNRTPAEIGSTAAAAKMSLGTMELNRIQSVVVP